MGAETVGGRCVLRVSSAASSKSDPQMHNSEAPYILWISGSHSPRNAFFFCPFSLFSVLLFFVFSFFPWPERYAKHRGRL